MGRQFEVRFEGSLAGSPVEVWEALTARTAGWLWPIDVEARLGGAVTGLTEAGDTVTVWEPPRHLAIRSEGDDGWFNNLDWTLEAWDRGTFLRYTHTGVSDEQNWDNDYEACRQHTELYYHTLGEYLRHFKGNLATYVKADVPEIVTFRTVWEAIGLRDKPSVGDRVRFEVPGCDPVDGVLDYVTANFIGLRTREGLLRFYGRDAFGWQVGVAHHLFGPDIDREKTERAWKAWLGGLYG